MIKLKKLHHSAYRCKDTNQTKNFYVDFLGLKLRKHLSLSLLKLIEKQKFCTFLLCLKRWFSNCFFEDPSTPFKFKKQRDFDLHIAFEVTFKDLNYFFDKGKKLEIETRGISDHGFIKSIYFRDPNGYIIELTTPIEKRNSQSKKA